MGIDVFGLLCFFHLLVDLSNSGQGSLLVVEHCWATLEVVGLSHGVVLVGEIDLGVKDVLKIVLSKWLFPVESVLKREFVELIELDESKSESVESSLQGIFLPVLKFDTKNMFDKLKEIII